MTGYIWHEKFMWHDTGNHAGILRPGGFLQPDQHFENPDTKRRIKNLLDASGITQHLKQLEFDAASEQVLGLFHSADYIQRIKKLSEDNGGDAGMLVPFGHDSFDIASMAAGGAIAAVDAVIAGITRNAYAFIRPPGHHAESDQGIGFCIFNNGVLAAINAISKHGLDRVAMVDIDVHHGNGAEKAFWQDRRVLTISVHQDNCFPPDSGALEDTGEGDGEGYNLNIPLPPGCGHGAYQYVFEKIIEPKLEKFRPQLIIVPCGLDAGCFDPLGRMMLHSESYRSITKKLKSIADKYCEQRLVFLHEGGYSRSTVPFFGLAIVEVLSDISTGVDDPFLPIMSNTGRQELQPYQRSEIDKIASTIDM